MGSRLTFREKAGDVCWQKQLRDKFLPEGTPPVPHLDVKRARVRPVSRNLAKQIILKYEWLGTMASTSWHYGIFFGNYCAGVCCLAHSGLAGAFLHRQFDIQRNELGVLCRGACVHWSPKGTNSKLVSWSSKLFLKENQNIRLILAFSDSDAGEVGTIYQAANWIYIGKRGGQRPAYVSPKGKIMNRRGIEYDRRVVKAVLDAGWKRQPENQKGCYAIIADKRDKPLAGIIESMRQPYPKRTPTGGASEPTEAGGSMPTRPLQIAGQAARVC